MFKIFQQPLQREPFSLKTVISSFFVGCFIALFLMVFQPFEINLWQTEYKIIKLLGYGLVTFITPIIVSLFISVLLSTKWLEEKWNVGYEIISTIFMILCIALGNILYSQFLGISKFTFMNYLNAIVITFSIGIFPIIFSVIFKYQTLLRKNNQNALQVNQSIKEIIPEYTSTAETQITFIAENNKDQLSIHPSNLIYIESIDNYSQITYTENGAIKKQILRGSLKRFESQIENPFIVRCHRSYIVNLHKVTKIDGNAAGYKLTLDQLDVKIPISRNYSNAVLELIKKNLK